MSRLTRAAQLSFLASCALAAVLLPACGSATTQSSPASSSPASSSAAAAATQAASGGALLTTASTSAGTVLAGPSGHTLYVLVDAQNHAVACTGDCLGAWPPLLAHAAPSAAGGVTATLATTSTAAGTQVTVNGLPVYYFSGDSAGGQANGEGIRSFGGTWHALDGAGNLVTGGASGGSGGGYAYP